MIEWSNLRNYNGSQNNAFEEICCQLAEYVEVPEHSYFTRKAAPDAGVECLWTLPNNDEWGWQAKYFLSPPKSSQWQQMEDSFKKAIEKHPKLKKYIFCLPIDRPDPKISGRNSFMDNWDHYVNKWKMIASKKGIIIELAYWGAHEIFEYLSREEHKGRFYFWFNREFFSNDWYAKRIKEAIASVGPRYTPKLNIETLISKSFEGLCRTEKFYNNLIENIVAIKKNINNSILPESEKFADQEYKNLFKIIEKIWDYHYLLIKQKHNESIDFKHLSNLVTQSKTSINLCKTAILNESDRLEKKESDRKSQTESSSSFNRPKYYTYQYNYLERTFVSLIHFEVLIDSNSAKLANNPLLMTGRAGTGKTHLFCDLSNQRIQDKLPSILLIGSQFYKSEPWKQILNLLGLQCSRDEFLGALEASAQSKKQKALILIDALNEGEGKLIWIDHLSSLIETLSSYKWISIGFSVRSNYEDLIVPDHIINDKLIHIEHHGFLGIEYDATQSFFNHYNIIIPNIPILNPEFRNPMFLKFFCECYSKGSIKPGSIGSVGMTNIFNLYIELINKKLSSTKFLDFDVHTNLVQKAIKKLAKIMALSGEKTIERDQVVTTFNNIYPKTGFDKSLLKSLIDEGLLIEDRYPIENNKFREVIQFSFERFTDHVIINSILEKYEKRTFINKLTRVIYHRKPWDRLLKNKAVAYMNYSLIEALSIQLPEKTGKELFELNNNPEVQDIISSTFINSLIWREQNSYGDKANLFIENIFTQNNKLLTQLFETLITISSIIEHPYNAKYLNEKLFSYDMAERDTVWSTFLHNFYESNSVVDRIIDSALSFNKPNDYHDQSINLMAITLSWFLTSSNRFLRDRTTKALVKLLEKRIGIIHILLKDFYKVNDVYLIERLFCVAYGCVMRSNGDKSMTTFIQDIYDLVFKDQNPPTHILLRDYARGIIEFGVSKRLKLDIEHSNIIPPYNSTWIKNIPTKEEIEKFKPQDGKWGSKTWALGHIYQSVMGFEDFARYIIGTNSNRFNWTSRKINESHKLTPKEKYDNFLISLTERQKSHYDKYYKSQSEYDLSLITKAIGNNESNDDSIKIDKLKKLITINKNKFSRTIGGKKIEIFNSDIIAYIDKPDNHQDLLSFDLSSVQRWIMNRVMELGWTVDRFGEFDFVVSSESNAGRSPHKAERMGKKYQWIAYYEFLSYVSDNFEFRYDEWSEKKIYEGPWDPHLRDIDPSNLIINTGYEGWDTHSKAWWFSAEYDNWESETPDIKWLKKYVDLPEIDKIINVKNLTNNSKWYLLDSYFRWVQPTPLDIDPYQVLHRDMWYEIKSYFIKKDDSEVFWKWAEKQHFYGKWMPSNHDQTGVFLGEYYWSPAYKYIHSRYYGYEGWTNLSGRIPCKVLVTNEGYLQEGSNYDCSINESVRINLPCELLIEKGGLIWGGKEGAYKYNNKIAVYDPSIETKGPGTLLIEENYLNNFLKENEYDLIWIIVGEKMIIGDSITPQIHPGRLEIGGVYKISNNKIIGQLSPKYVKN